MISSSFLALVASTVIVFFAVFKSLRKRLSPAQIFTESLPWIGSDYGRFSWLRALLRSVLKSEEMVEEGYTPVQRPNLRLKYVYLQIISSPRKTVYSSFPPCQLAQWLCSPPPI